MVVAGIVNPSCVRRPGEGPHSPAHGVARLAVLVRRLWSSECERRGGRLYLLSTLPDEGRPWAERSCALAFYGRRGAVGFVPQPWPSVAPAPPLTDDRTAPAVEDTCAVCLEPLSSRTATSCPPPTPTRALRRVVGAWGGCAARMPSAVSATPAFRRRAPAARYAATRAASECGGHVHACTTRTILEMQHSLQYKCTSSVAVFTHVCFARRASRCFRCLLL